MSYIIYMDTTQPTTRNPEAPMYVCNHFSAATRRALAKKGIRITGLQALADMSKPMPFANAETGYMVDDNGCGKVWTFAQVLEAAKPANGSV